MDIADVKQLAIYPAIGIARIGNSPEAYFLGPTIPGEAATDKDDFRDNKGRIKRQAARFSVYALDGSGEIIGELTENDGVRIDWRVAVANKKAAWYQFDLALDIPAAQGEYDKNGVATPGGPPLLSRRRNADFKGDDRQLLVIDGGEQQISGTCQNAGGNTHHFEGKIGREQTPVYLGELRTDESGRLLFLGGLGNSASFNDSPLTTFANNAGWYDDTSDGPVDARVTLPDGRKLEAKSAWVVTAPPNYAVGVEAITTGYDLLLDVAYSQCPAIEPKVPAFYRDIYPILRHFSLNQWVNAGLSRDFGWGSGYDFEHESVLARLMDPGDLSRPFRQTIFESFRNPAFDKPQANAWPQIYGDGVAFNVDADDPRNWYAVTTLQYARLAMWAQGQFTVDDPPAPKNWDDMSPAEQANGLTEAALAETLGGPFHPGCEFTWPMRNAIMYESGKPFRIRRRESAREDYGVAINPDIAFADGGPLDGSAPGDITRWMAVPWQTDTSSCLSAYKSFAGEYLPTFWPARVPNDVLTHSNYCKICEEGASAEEQIEAFSPAQRKKWLRGFIYDDQGNPLPNNHNRGIEKFTQDWHQVGIVLKKPLHAEPALFPKEAWVETGRNLHDDDTQGQPAGVGTALDRQQKRPDWLDRNPRDLR